MKTSWDVCGNAVHGRLKLRNVSGAYSTKRVGFSRATCVGEPVVRTVGVLAVDPMMAIGHRNTAA